MQLVLWTLLFVGATLASKLETVYEWKYLDFLWESQAQKESFIRNGDYDYTNILPIDVDKARDGRVFITTIRDAGVPVTLSTVSDKVGPAGPLLKPYPDWSWYQKGDCNGITSVYRVAIDDCNKLYVLDTGMVGGTYACPAQVLIFDLRNDKLINRITIPDNVAQNKQGVGTLCTPVVQTEGPKCNLENIFMADVNGHGLVIYNRDRVFRLEAQAFEPEPSYVNVTIAGETFELEDSLMGMALSPSSRAGEGSDLLLRPFSSRAIYAADTQVLSRSNYGDSIKYKIGRDMLPSQATAMGMSSQGVLFFGLTREIAIGCWNRNRDMTSNNVDLAVQDTNRLQFVSGLKVLPRSRTNTEEEVWSFSNRIQKLSLGTMDYNEINFRVLKSSVKDLIRGTKCEAAGRRKPQYH